MAYCVFNKPDNRELGDLLCNHRTVGLPSFLPSGVQVLEAHDGDLSGPKGLSVGFALRQTTLITFDRIYFTKHT